eukprot:Plantae.Rhodophyta-Hildenbrandia_rubra.ctg22850.p1 GENE.Plantae.Rhodophyta-Hildenbrandia_rubra.ctg22850~~Plantae.Rhodophyta-Hildenbrandia_rubra.ctg22850.p1  ORF type:complete len:183 (-),score=18.40 Plantae.Rhodophyta-Hildenbrandia_rubra.ctg22850:102-650(-)
MLKCGAAAQSRWIVESASNQRRGCNAAPMLHEFDNDAASSTRRIHALADEHSLAPACQAKSSYAGDADARPLSFGKLALLNSDYGWRENGISEERSFELLGLRGESWAEIMRGANCLKQRLQPAPQFRDAPAHAADESARRVAGSFYDQQRASESNLESFSLAEGIKELIQRGCSGGYQRAL